jgi:hypothetical protein
LQTPYFNQRADVLAFFDYLVDCRKYLKIIPTKHQIHRNVYPEQAFEDHQIRLIMSLLLRLIEQFLVHQSFFEDSVKVKNRLASIYRERNLLKHFERSLRHTKQLQENSPFRNADYFFDSYQIQLEEYQSIAARKRISALNLQTISDELDTAFIALKLRQTCLSLSHQAVYKTAYNFGLLQEILTYIEEHDLLHIPAISVYYYCYRSLTDPLEVSNFQVFKRLIIEESSKFPLGEIRDLYLLAINFCTKQYNEGNPEYLKDSFDLYKEGLRNACLLSGGVLSRFTYRNIVTHGLIMKEYKWLEYFLHEYKDKLELPYRESMFSFCLARLEYSRNNYGEALSLLQRSDYQDILLNLSAKTVMLKIFYELGEFDLLESHLGAMRTFLRRKDIIGYHKENYKNLIRFTQKLLEVKPFDAKNKDALRRDITQTKSLAERTWLMNALSKI